METGYVLNFSDRTMREFFADEFGIDIDDPQYMTGGTSKAKRMRTFLRVAEPPLLGEVLEKLLQHRLLYNTEISAEVQAHYRGLANRLRVGTTAPERSDGVDMRKFHGHLDPEQRRVIDAVLAGILEQLGSGRQSVLGSELRFALRDLERQHQAAVIQSCIPRLLLPGQDDSYQPTLDGLLEATDPRTTRALESSLKLISGRYAQAGGRRQRALLWSDVRNGGAFERDDFDVVWLTLTLGQVAYAGRPPAGASDDPRSPKYDYEFRLREQDLELIYENGDVPAWATVQRTRIAAMKAMPGASSRSFLTETAKRQGSEPVESSGDTLDQPRANTSHPPEGDASTRYEISERLGEGRFAEVFRARDTLLKRDVALKFLRKDAVGVTALEHARALARVAHANIVSVFDIKIVKHPSDGQLVDAVVMELVPGIQLTERLGQRLSPEEARRIGEAIIDGIAAYHANGLAHLDLHEANIMVGDEALKILDPLYFDTAVLSSTATRSSQQVRDLREVRNILVQVLSLVVSKDDVMKFEHDNMKPTIESLREALGALL
jgi:hypothetical protein